MAAGLAAIVGDRDANLYEGQAGLRDPDRGAVMTGDTIFWLASCTKLVTSVAALQLAERGLLALDMPIDDVLPDLAGYRVLARIGAGSLGWAGLANTYHWADPAAGICAVLSAQHLPFAEPAMVDTVRAFERATYAGFG